MLTHPETITSNLQQKDYTRIENITRSVVLFYRKKVTHNNTIYIAPMLFLGANFVQIFFFSMSSTLSLGIQKEEITLFSVYLAPFFFFFFLFFSVAFFSLETKKKE